MSVIEPAAHSARTLISLADAPALDGHCHGWKTSELLEQDQEGYLDRVTMLGMCLISSGLVDEGFEAPLRQATAATPMAAALKRRLAVLLDAGEDEVVERRFAELSHDPAAYYARLWSDAGIEGLLVDEGYPQPRIVGTELGREAGVPVHRVARIEPFIEEAREAATSFHELEDAFVAALERAAAEGAVAFKSIIAYRTGLDVRAWSATEAEAAFSAWRGAGFAESREHAKPVRDALLRRTLEVARQVDRPVHIHCGGGDPSIVYSHARPQALFPLLHEFRHQPVVLIHGGWPWMEEAAFIASVLPLVYLDVSVMAPWASLAIDQKLEMLLGVAPTSRVVYGSDHASEPEVLWFTAHVVRRSLERVLSRAIEHDWMTTDEALATGFAVMAGNTRRLHGLD
jgi:predicted TIM-barrel fold metal-dependent hydrolase